jgi:outer membrane protein, multidrug efflux system
MNNISSILLFFMLAVLSLAGCKSLDTQVKINSPTSPSQFIGTDDYLSAEVPNWRAFFNDSTLEALIDTALQRNIDLQQALQRIEIARSRVTAAHGALRPEVNLAPSAAIRRFGLYTMDGAGNITTDITPGQIVPINLPDFFLGAKSSWEVDLWGKLRNTKKAGLANLQASTESARLVISTLVAEVAAAYFELIALENELITVQEFITAQRNAVNVITSQKEAGRANELSVQQFTSQLLEAEIMEFEIKQQITETENLLNFLLGRYPQPLPRKATALFPIDSELIRTGIPADLLNNRPDIREASQRVEASRYELQAARAAFFPSLNLSAGIGYQAFSGKYLFLTPTSLAYTAIGELTAPLVNRAALKAAFNEARASQIDALWEYHQTILSAYVEVVNELSNLKNLERITTQRKTQSDLLNNSVQTANALYTSAKADYLEVLFAQQNALMSELEYIRSIKQQRFSSIQLYKALGGGWK